MEKMNGIGARNADEGNAAGVHDAGKRREAFGRSGEALHDSFQTKEKRFNEPRLRFVFGRIDARRASVWRGE